MMKFSRIPVLPLLLVAACASDAAAGAWTMPQGKLYDRLAAGYYFAEREFNGDGDRRRMSDNGEFSDINLQNYLEYGITDSLTVVNSLYYKRIEKEEETLRTTTYGIGDIDLALKYRLYEGKAGVVALQGLVKIPEAYDEEDDLPLGNGQYDIEGKVLYGRSLYPYVPGYCNFELGYRWRFEEPSDELRYLVEVGGDITDSLFIRAKLDGITSMDNGAHEDEAGNPTTTNNFDLGKLDMTVGYRVAPEWMIELSYTPALYGRTTAAGATWSVAVAYKGL